VRVFVGKRHSAEAVAIRGNVRILGEVVSRKQGEGDPSGLEKDDAFSVGH